MVQLPPIVQQLAEEVVDMAARYAICPRGLLAGVEVRLYDVLFKSEEPGMVYERDAEGHVVARTKLEDPNAWLADLNPESLQTLTGCYGCPRLAQLKPGDRVQFERLGFFCVDPDTAPGRLVVNRTVTLKASVPLAVEQAKAQAVNGR
ncbi:hypothetical protein V8C86DRAFT_3101364 [Haematococcus lacustris]